MPMSNPKVPKLDCCAQVSVPNTSTYEPTSPARTITGAMSARSHRQRGRRPAPGLSASTSASEASISASDEADRAGTGRNLSGERTRIRGVNCTTGVYGWAWSDRPRRLTRDGRPAVRGPRAPDRTEAGPEARPDRTEAGPRPDPRPGGTRGRTGPRPDRTEAGPDLRRAAG